MPSPFPCSPVICEWLWKKAQIQNKKSYFQLYLQHLQIIYEYFIQPLFVVSLEIFIWRFILKQV